MQRRTCRQTFFLVTTSFNVQTGLHSSLCLGKRSLSHLLSAIDIYMEFLFFKGITAKHILESP